MPLTRDRPRSVFCVPLERSHSNPLFPLSIFTSSPRPNDPTLAATLFEFLPVSTHDPPWTATEACIPFSTAESSTVSRTQLMANGTSIYPLFCPRFLLLPSISPFPSSISEYHLDFPLSLLVLATWQRKTVVMLTSCVVLAPPSSYHLNEPGMLTRSRQRNNSTLSQTSTSTAAATSDGSEQQYAPGASHLFEDSEPDSPLSSAYTASPVLNSSRLSNHGGGRHSRAGGRDSDASASGASNFGPERTSGASSPIASTSYHANPGSGGTGHPSNVNPATGKRKRSRVTPVQLAHLERVFAKDRSPTAVKRKELAEVLGMNERQTQVWFQNRRAKAKLLEHRARSGGGPGGASRPPVLQGDNSGSSNGASYADSASGGIDGGDADVLGRIHEDEGKSNRVPLLPPNLIATATYTLFNLLASTSPCAPPRVCPQPCSLFHAVIFA